MSKFRHIDINNEEIHIKKKPKKLKEELPSNYDQTINLMEKLGIKMINNENLLKSINLRKSSKMEIKKNVSNFNEEEKLNKPIKSTSLQKRKKNLNKKDFTLASNEKRFSKNEMIKKRESEGGEMIVIKKYVKDEKKENDNFNTKKRMSKIPNKKEKENVIFSSAKKRMSNINNYDEDNNKIIIKKLKSNENRENKRASYRSKKIEKFINVEQDNNNNKSTKKNNELKDNKKPISDKKHNGLNLTNNNIKNEFPKKFGDTSSKNQNRKSKIKHKSNSVQKDFKDQIFNFSLKTSSKNIKNISKNKYNNTNESSEKNIISNKIKERNNAEKRLSLEHAHSRHIKTDNNEDSQNQSIFNFKGRSESAEAKRSRKRSNQRHATEIITGNNLNLIMNRNSSKKINQSTNNMSKDFDKRRTLANPKAREKFENLLNSITLRLNGGNTQYLTNYENGDVYTRPIEIQIKNQNCIKNIKIGSCTKPGCSGPGIVKINQDAYFIKEQFLENENSYFMGICDGHGEKGQIISQYVAEKLPEYIKNINNESIINEFKNINKEIYENKNIESSMSGTTVSSLILTSEKIHSINLGDSRACIFKYENGLYSYKYLTRDHTPNEKDESLRIINSNGRIMRCYDEMNKKYIGPERVWLKNKDEPGLAMTRSIGDKIAHTIGVLDEPEFKYYEYDGNEKFIIIASDGIWEYLNGDDCIKILKKYYEEELPIEQACYALVKDSFDKWKRKEVTIDDITAIVIFFYD